MPVEKKWIYKSNWDFTLVVKPTIKTGVPDGQGNLSNIIVSKPIKLVFVNGTMVINEMIAQRHGCTPEQLVQWTEMQHTFGKHFFLAQSPDMSLTKEEVEELEEQTKQARRGRPPKVFHGAKATDSYSKR